MSAPRKLAAILAADYRGIATSTSIGCVSPAGNSCRTTARAR